MSLVLIADDNPHAHRMGRQILTQEGYEVATTSDGDETLRYLAENQPDLVLVDTRMPGPSGFEVCRRIKRHPKLRNVKVVLLAGPLEPFDPAQAEAAGSDGVLHKPLDAYSLIDAVRSLIGEATPSPVVAGGGEAEGEGEPAASLRALDRSSSTADLPEAPDPFDDAVQEALGEEQLSGPSEEAIRQAIQEAVASVLPELVDTLTRRVLERLKQP